MGESTRPGTVDQRLAAGGAHGRARTRRSYWGAFAVGVALMAGVDEIVFHQLLRWHHFIDAGTSEFGIVSDGILHALELFLLVGGFALLLDARRRGVFGRTAAWAGVVTGLGAFQLWDGLVDHKVLGLHQVRYGVELLAYDLAWIGSGAAVLAVGIALTVRAARRRA